MDAVSNTTVNNASLGDPGTVQGNASMLVLKKAMNHEAAAAAQLIASLPQPALATSGPLGTRIDTYA